MREKEKFFCNRCGREIKSEQGIVKEGCFHATQNWGYFSNRDGLEDNFDLCEECYDKITENFKIPVERKEVREYL